MKLIKWSMLVLCYLLMIMSVFNPVMGNISNNEWNSILYLKSVTPVSNIRILDLGIDPSTNALKITFPSNPSDIQTISYAVNFYKNAQRICPNVNGCQYFMTDNYGNVVGTMNTPRIWYNELLWQSNGIATSESWTNLVQKTVNTYQQYRSYNPSSNPSSTGSSYKTESRAEMEERLCSKSSCEAWNAHVDEYWLKYGMVNTKHVCDYCEAP